MVPAVEAGSANPLDAAFASELAHAEAGGESSSPRNPFEVDTEATAGRELGPAVAAAAAEAASPSWPQASPPPTEPPQEDGASAWDGLSSPRGEGAILRPARKRGIPWSVWLVAMFGPSLIACIAIIVILLSQARKDRNALKEAQGKFVHPLMDMPDYGWYFHEGGQRTVVDPRQNPAKEIFVRLGSSIELDKSLSATPLEVARMPLKYALKDGKPNVDANVKALAVKLRLRNTTDYAFHPTDPVFNLAYSRAWPSYTFLELNGRQYYGPVRDPAAEILDGTQFHPLWPKAVDGRPNEMETWVFAFQDAAAGQESAVQALDRVAAGTTLLWRIHLRKGRKSVPASGDRVAWVTTQIIVQFSPDEVRGER
jgi:hypothetical protein